MRRVYFRAILVRVVRSTVAVLFFWAAYAKAVVPAHGPTMYQQWLLAYPALRYWVPGMEVGLAVWLMLGLWPRLASFSALVMLSAFSGLIIFELMKEHPKPCGCMGALAAAYEPSTIRMGLLLSLARNILMAGAACYCYVASSMNVLHRNAAPAGASGERAVPVSYPVET